MNSKGEMVQTESQVGEGIATPGMWRDGLYVLDGSIVGTVAEDAFHRGWWAHGCMNDWQDTELRLHETKTDAMCAVEKWALSESH